MEHKNSFTQQEIDRIRELLKEKSRAYSKSDQKGIRDRLRRMGFYITDYDISGRGFSVFDFDRLVRRGVIREEANKPTKRESIKVSVAKKGREIQIPDGLRPPPEKVDWSFCQENSDEILSGGLKILINSNQNSWGAIYEDGSGVYLFRTGMGVTS